MTGNIALDVVIGLVFIYLLYSLFATVIMEIINTLLGLRARNLRYALRRMLKDEKEPETPVKSVLYKLGNFLVKPTGFATNLKNDGLFDAFYAKPAIKYLSAGGIANKPSYITPRNFSTTLINVIQESGDGTITPQRKNTLQKVQIGIDQLPNGSDTKAHLESLLAEAQNDLEKFKELLELWFNETMNRAAGWFKRRIQFFLLVIGFILAISFNADTLVIIKKLSNDSEARNQLVELAISYTKDNQGLIEEFNRLRSDASTSNDSINIKQVIQKVSTNIDSLQRVSNMLKNDIAEAQNIVNANWDFLKAKSEDKVTFWNKLGYVLSWKYIWGYLFTALAISMGSPFWFDLLNRLIHFRNSVKVNNTANEMEKNGTSADEASTINRVG